MKLNHKPFHKFQVGDTVYLDKGIDSRRDCSWVIKEIVHPSLPIRYGLTKDGEKMEYVVTGREITIEKAREENK